MGAWIEIYHKEYIKKLAQVAPHDGCVDWNSQADLKKNEPLVSHPTMGAWIEMTKQDRRFWKGECRTPRWVRGLKLVDEESGLECKTVAPHDGCVDWNNVLIMKKQENIVAPHDGCVDWNLQRAH